VFVEKLEKLSGIKPYLAKKAIEIQMGRRKNNAAKSFRQYIQRKTHRTKSQAQNRNIQVATKRAEKKVERALVSGKLRNGDTFAPVAVNRVPRDIGYKFKLPKGNRNGKNKRRSNGIILKGSQLLRTVSIATSAVVGDVLATIDLSPSVTNVGPLQFQSQLFERFRIRKFTIEYDTQMPTSTIGQLVMYSDPDPNDDPGSGQLTINRALSTKNGKAFALYSNQKHNCLFNKAMLWTSPGNEDRLTSGGKFYLLCNFSAGNLPDNPTDVGTLILHYEVEFDVPIWEAQNPIVYAQGEWYNGANQTPALPFGDSLVPNGIPSIGVSYDSSNGASEFHIPQGFFTVAIYLWTTDTTPSSPTLSLTGLTIATLYKSIMGPATFPNGKYGYMWNLTITTTGTNPVLKITSNDSDVYQAYFDIARCIPDGGARKRKPIQMIEELENRLRALEGKQEVGNLEQECEFCLRLGHVEEDCARKKKFLADKVKSGLLTPTKEPRK